jgi:hypothetical protein
MNDPPRYVTYEQYKGAYQRISDQFASIQAQIDDIHRRRRTALQEMEKNITDAFVAGRAAVEAQVAAADLLAREREHGIDLKVSQLRSEVIVLQEAVAAQIGPGRLSALEQQVRDLVDRRASEITERRARRFAFLLAVLTGLISVVVTVATVTIDNSITGHSSPSPAVSHAPSPSPSPSPSSSQTCVPTSRGIECYHIPRALAG